MTTTRANDSITSRTLPPLSLSHDHELYGNLPEGLNPAKAIAEIKKMLVERQG